MNSFLKQPSRYEKGQGLIEYLLILVLVAVVVIVVLALIGRGISAIFPKKAEPVPLPGATSTVQIPSLPRLSGEPILDIQELGSNTELIIQDTYPLKNCNNPAEISADVTRSRTFENKTDLLGEVEAGLSSQLTLSLRGHYGLEETISGEQTNTLHLTVLPFSSMDFILEWHYVVAEGIINITDDYGNVYAYPYKIRSSMVFKVVDTIQQPCPATPTPIEPTATPTMMPTETPVATPIPDVNG